MCGIFTYIWLIVMVNAGKYTSRAGQAGGGSFKREKTIRQRQNLPIECAVRPTSAMPKPRFLCAPSFGRSVWWWLVVFPRCSGGGDVKYIQKSCDVVW